MEAEGTEDVGSKLGATLPPGHIARLRLAANLSTAHSHLQANGKYNLRHVMFKELRQVCQRFVEHFIDPSHIS